MAEGTNLAKAYVQILPSMDGFQSKLEKEMGGSGEAAGKKSGTSFGGAFSAAAGAAAKAGIAAVTAAGAGVVALTKSAVSAYGEYEQLVGGVNKLFGDASKQLMGYAEEAYKTSGLSANEYMEQATSFSAAMIKSLGGDTKKAAEITDVAMRAMSDNVNTFGTDMTAVQNAFQGFSKQNYTMLDNLKLGYGGTKSEMERLIADANTYAASIGQASDLSIDSFADIVQAIELVQKKQNIAGTTAKEAASTLQGSFEMTKSAWTNLVAGLANPDADMGKLVTNFVESAQAALSNLLPVIKTGLQGVGRMAAELLPEIFKMIPDLLDDILPGLLDTIDTVVTEVFPVLTDVIVKNLPMIITTVVKAGKTIVKSLFTAIDKELSGNKIYDTIKSGLSKLLPIFSDVGGSLMESGKQIFNSITELASKIDFDAIFGAIAKAAETVAPVLKDAGEAIAWLFDNAISPLIEWAANNVIPVAIDALSAAFRIFKKAIEGVKPILSFVWDNFLKPLAEWTGEAVTIALGAVSDALSTIADNFEELDWEGWYEDFDNFAENWKTGAADIGQALLDNAGEIDEFFNTSAFGEGWNEFWQDVGGAVADAVAFVKDNWSDGEQALEDFGAKTFDVVDEFKENWKTGEQSLEDFGAKVFDIVSDFGDNWDTGEQAMEDFGAKAFDVIDDFKTDWKNGAATLKTNITNVGTWFSDLGNKIADLATKAWEWGSDLVTSFIDGIKDSFSDLESTMESFGEMIYDYIHFSEPDKGALSNFETYAPDMVHSFAKGIHDNAHVVETEMQDLSSVMDSALRIPAYTPYRATQTSPATAQAQGGTITLRMVDNANRLIAEGTAGIIDIINGNTVALSERGLASV
jgi:phage-related protein